MKKCSICKENKELFEFNKCKTKTGGYQTLCRCCSKAKSKIYYRINRETKIEHMKEGRRKRRKEKRKVVNSIKSKGCSTCSEKEICCMEFHHLDPAEKYRCVAEMLVRECSIENILNEISKCALVCSNCHRKIHADVIEYFHSDSDEG